MLNPDSNPILNSCWFIFLPAVVTDYCVVLKECDNTVGVFISPAVTDWMFQWEWMSLCAYADHVISFCELTRHTRRPVSQYFALAFVPHIQLFCGPDEPRSLCLQPDKSDKRKVLSFPPPHCITSKLLYRWGFFSKPCMWEWWLPCTTTINGTDILTILKVRTVLWSCWAITVCMSLKQMAGQPVTLVQQTCQPKAKRIPPAKSP